jgi:RNA polymerase sigma factor (sigma-70 family)
MSTVTNDELAAGLRETSSEGQSFTPQRIAAILERWRPEVLREMERTRLWHGANRADLEDQFQDVALVLCARTYASESHLKKALWMGLGFRARDHWKAARRRELPVGEFFEGILGDDRLDAVEDAAAAAADSRQVDDCLAELDELERTVYKLAKGEGLSRRKVAKAAGLSEADVLRALYSAQRKIDQVAVLAVAGRLCGRRRPAVESLARGQARGLTREQARAHLKHCRECLLAFRAERAALSARVAAVLPLPAALGQDEGFGVAAMLDTVRAVPRAVKRQLYEIAGRPPSGGEEAAVGAGGAALGTKVVVTLCVGAATGGGGAVCINELSGSPDGRTEEPKPARQAKVREKPKTRPVKAAQAPEAEAEQQQQPEKQESQGSQGGTSEAPQSAPPSVQKDPPQEFFGGGGSSGGSNEAQPSSTPPSSSSGSGSGSSGGGASSQGGSGAGEFFGG